MICPDCNSHIDESMDKHHQSFTCRKCGFEVFRDYNDALNRYRQREKEQEKENQESKTIKKIDRIPRDLGIINHIALYNHNECVNKINEIIEVLNAHEIKDGINKKSLYTEERLILNHQEQEQILKNLSGLCEQYGRYTCAIFDFYRDKNTKCTPTNYKLFLGYIKKAIIKSLTYYKLPLLDTSPFSFLKENIEYIIGGKRYILRYVLTLIC